MVNGITTPFDPLGTRTSSDPLGTSKPKEKSEAQLSCEAKGGRWDEANQRCILPDTTPPPKVDAPGVETFKSSETGKPSGITIDGKTYLGINADDIQTLVASKQAEEDKLLGTAPVGTFAKQQAIEQERQRLIAEETPVRRELSPEFGTDEETPVIGGAVGALRRVFNHSAKRSLKNILSGDEIKDVALTPETMRTAVLTEIERQEIERGLTDSENFGQLIEGIPVVGSLAGKYAGGLIETPSENAREVKSNILKEKRRIANIETNVKLGYLPVSVAQEQITDIENNVQRLESRIRLLIYNSPELRFNSDYVNTVETEILLTREKAFQAKQNILTGATINPTEIQLLQQLQFTGEDLE